jgi:aminoglycoside phosphotransferase (APT) family kinase protein
VQELILRLGPDFGLFAPYSAGPQVLAMRSLEGTAVPCRAPTGAATIPAILGAPSCSARRSRARRRAVGVGPRAGLEEATASDSGRSSSTRWRALHCVRWAEQPIAEMAHGITAENAAEQNVAQWQALIERWAMRPYPLAECGIRWLKSNHPVAPRVTIVHGDYRTGNFLEQDGRITAILDWELVHLGDPHEDLAWASMPMYMGGSKLICRLAEPDWFYARYAERAGYEVSMASVRYYQVFSLLKLAATHMAAARCFEEGRFNDMRMPAMGSQIATCLRQMDKLIEST